ncbi:MAG: histidine kinase, partial [Clostridia bacterium]|nr:histidine kinase [Clostridia bacterium]
WLAEAGVKVEQGKAVGEEGRARTFPTCGGILQCMDRNNPDYTYFAVDGVENCMRVLEDVVSGGGKHAFVEMSACSGSCVGGPIMDKHHCLLLSDYQEVVRYAKPKDFSIPQPAPTEIAREHTSLKRGTYQPGETAIREVLAKMGKTSVADELNCGSCGYDTCREKAIAVLLGKADMNMCLPFLLAKAESFSDTIIKNTPNAILVVNEAMEVHQINAAACKLMNISDPRNVLGDQLVHILDPMPFIQAYSQERNLVQKHVYLADYKKYVDQTVLYIKSCHILICIMRDITEEARAQERKEELSQTTIEITDKVIEKQMRAVQEIASLLGETTAETKVALTKLKESLGHE